MFLLPKILRTCTAQHNLDYYQVCTFSHQTHGLSQAHLVMIWNSFYKIIFNDNLRKVLTITIEFYISNNILAVLAYHSLL